MIATNLLIIGATTVKIVEVATNIFIIACIWKIWKIYGGKNNEEKDEEGKK